MKKEDLDRILLDIGYEKSRYAYSDDRFHRPRETIHERVNKLEKESNAHHITVKIPTDTKHFSMEERCHNPYTTITLQEFVTLLCDHLKLEYQPKTCESHKIIRQRSKK